MQKMRRRMIGAYGTAAAVLDTELDRKIDGGMAAFDNSVVDEQIAELRGNRYAREFADERDRALQIETGTVAYRKEAVDAAQKAHA